MRSDGAGFRGYISSRPVRGTHFPQRVQNLVVRSYAARNHLTFKLSLAEYAMPGCFMMMETLLEELPELAGIITFSMFMLPSRRSARARFYARVIDSGAQLHAALEDTAIRSATDIPLFEDTIQVAAALARAPLRGRFVKDNRPHEPSDEFAVQLRQALTSS
jgi:sporadic carbohydrate cluster protein (TIGR04323 family)